MDALSAPPFVFIACHHYEKASPHLWDQRRRDIRCHFTVGPGWPKNNGCFPSARRSNNGWQTKEDRLRAISNVPSLNGDIRQTLRSYSIVMYDQQLPPVRDSDWWPSEGRHPSTYLFTARYVKHMILAMCNHLLTHLTGWKHAGSGLNCVCAKRICFSPSKAFKSGENKVAKLWARKQT